MGDRANIAILPEWGFEVNDNITDEQVPVPVVLYGHWSGESYIEDARRALSKKWRWDDDAYLTRIIADEFIHERGKETGYGISAGTLGDNEHPILHVNTRTQRVSLHDDLLFNPPADAGVSFEEFVNGLDPQVA